MTNNKLYGEIEVVLYKLLIFHGKQFILSSEWLNFYFLHLLCTSTNVVDCVPSNALLMWLLRSFQTLLDLHFFRSILLSIYCSFTQFLILSVTSWNLKITSIFMHHCSYSSFHQRRNVCLEQAIRTSSFTHYLNSHMFYLVNLKLWIPICSNKNDEKYSLYWFIRTENDYLQIYNQLQ